MQGISKYAESNTATFVNELITDCEMVDELVFQNTFDGIDALNQFIIVSAFVLATNKIIFLVMIILTVFTALAMHLGSDEMQKFGKAYSDTKENYYAFIKDTFANFMLIKSFGINEAIEERHLLKNTALFEVRRKQQNVYCKKNIIAQLAGLGSTLLIMAITSYFAMKGSVTVGFVVIAGELVGRIIYPITILPSLIMNYQTAIPIVDKIEKNEIVNEEKRVYKALNIISNIQLENVSFKYKENEALVLNHISHIFEKGKKYLVVGESGCGKSTFLKVLSESVEGYTGTKRINGNLASEYDKKDVIRKIGYLTQDILLIDDSVLNNLTLFKDISSEKIRLAMQAAGLDECELERGLETKVGEGGSKFSGGEKQRIAFARMLLHDFSWLLLDEFTANIDVEKSNQIEEKILNASEISVINISHRLSKKTVKLYDEIIMMDKGQIIEAGKFDDLIQLKGKFYAMAVLNNIV